VKQGRFTPPDRALLAVLLHRLRPRALRRMQLSIRPGTVLSWHRDLIRKRHAARSRPSRPGRPRTGRSICAGEESGAEVISSSPTSDLVPCVLGGLPQAAIVQADGTPLPVGLVRAPNRSLRPAVLAPGTLNAADLVVFWANWCGRPPGPLSVRITLPAAGGVVTGPFNGPPDYNLVPECFSRGQPSTISVIDAYGPGLAG
jgi:hypothetical protein